MKLLGIDTGGTFTDFVYFDGQVLRTHKVLSTPDAPERAILQGISDLNISLSEELRIVHGSTVATNAVLEGKGARTVYISNRGFKDVLTIGRQARKQLYNLTPELTTPPVPSKNCLETSGRITAKGEVLEPLTEADLEELNIELEKLKPEAVAINLLFSYIDPSFENKIADAIEKSCFVSCSSKILPVYREYERGIATWLNAYVGPLMKGYLKRLQDQLGQSGVSVMRSSGNTCNAGQAGDEAVHLLLSGPAGGIKAAHHLSNYIATSNLLSFDMGGTSTDVALVDGELDITGESEIAGYPVCIPMINIHTIGAGGGSIAYIDDGGLLQVGPESAGASPGPACYGQGGISATVTDANLILGRIPKGIRLGESLTIDFTNAEVAIAKLTERLGLASDCETAAGIIKLANEHMAQALRVISVERGIDPRGFCLMAFGGAGGLHVCELAEQLGMTQAVAPNHAGVLSALGMLVAKPGRHITHTIGCLLKDIDEYQIEEEINKLTIQARQALTREGHNTEKTIDTTALDLCYHGQAHTLTVPWSDKTDCENSFHQLHLSRYGHRLETPVELVNIRVGIELEQDLSLNFGTNHATNDLQVDNQGSFLWRSQLVAGDVIVGERIICDPDSTIWVAPGWQAVKDQFGNVVLTKL